MKKIIFSDMVCGFLASACHNSTMYEASMADKFLFWNNPLLSRRQILMSSTFTLKKSIFYKIFQSRVLSFQMSLKFNWFHRLMGKNFQTYIVAFAHLWYLCQQILTSSSHHYISLFLHSFFIGLRITQKNLTMCYYKTCHRNCLTTLVGGVTAVPRSKQSISETCSIHVSDVMFSDLKNRYI